MHHGVVSNWRLVNWCQAQKRLETKSLYWIRVLYFTCYFPVIPIFLIYSIYIKGVRNLFSCSSSFPIILAMPGDNSSSSSTSAVSGLRNDTNASNNWKTKKIEWKAQRISVVKTRSYCHYLRACQIVFFNLRVCVFWQNPREGVSIFNETRICPLCWYRAD